MHYFLRNNKNFLAIIIAAIIIGGFIYLDLSRQSGIPPEAGKVGGASDIPPTVKPQITTKSDLVPKLAINNTACGAENNTIVTKVIDGDTVVVEGGWHVRLLGMDADEKGYPCYDAAKNRLENLVLAKQIILEKDVTNVDQYGRCLRYIFIGSTNVDAQLVKEGLAVARFYEPDVKYRAEISSAEIYAQQNKIGCKWSSALQVAQ